MAQTSTVSQVLPLIIVFALLGVGGWVGYQVYISVAKMSDVASERMGKKNVVFTKDGVKVGVKQVKTENYVDATQSWFVKAWNLGTAQDGSQAKSTIMTYKARNFKAVANLAPPSLRYSLTREPCSAAHASAGGPAPFEWHRVVESDSKYILPLRVPSWTTRAFQNYTNDPEILIRVDSTWEHLSQTIVTVGHVVLPSHGLVLEVLGQGIRPGRVLLVKGLTATNDIEQHFDVLGTSAQRCHQAIGLSPELCCSNVESLALSSEMVVDATAPVDKEIERATTPFAFDQVDGSFNSEEKYGGQSRVVLGQGWIFEGDECGRKCASIVTQSLGFKVASRTNAVTERSQGAGFKSKLKMGSWPYLIGLEKRDNEFHPSARMVMSRQENKI
ncbi:hypothetical protein HG531_006034 [Fusarium graminearum]|nr:hypothetical protein HG531_006034 [Fusarium graminearum]